MNKVTIIHPRLQHIGMTTANTDALLNWYRTVLGMSLVHRTSSATGDQKAGPNLMAAWVSNDEATIAWRSFSCRVSVRIPREHIIAGSSTSLLSTELSTTCSGPMHV